MLKIKSTPHNFQQSSCMSRLNNFVALSQKILALSTIKFAKIFLRQKLFPIEVIAYNGSHSWFDREILSEKQNFSVVLSFKGLRIEPK